MTDALEAKLRAAVKAGARDAQGGFTDGRQNSGDGQGRQGSVDPGGRRHARGRRGQRMSEAELEQRKNELLAKLRAKTPALRK